MSKLLYRCQENGKMVERSVRPLPRDPDVVDEIEKKVRSVPNFLRERQSLWSLVSEPGAAFFLVDDVGLIGAADIRQGFYGHAHITFWDHKLRGRAFLCESVGRFLMECCQLHFLLTAIPEDRLSVIEFAATAGFQLVERSNGAVLMALMREKAKWD